MIAGLKRIDSPLHRAYALMAVTLMFITALWFHSRDWQTRWSNVPPAPSEKNRFISGVGDMQLAYRFYALMLQNMGNTSGRIIAFDHYNYHHLSDWLFAISDMDKRSVLPPFLASYYFSNVKDRDKLRLVIRYLSEAGQKPSPKGVGEPNWRWLGQAIALARFELKDLDLALELAYKLAALNTPDMPIWTKQMPAFILNNKGNKDGAYQIMLKILQSNAESLPPEELFFTRDYICRRLQTREQAQNNPLCQYKETLE